MRRTDSGDGSTSRVRSRSQVHPGYSRLEGAAQGALFVLLGGLFMTLAVISALAFGLSPASEAHLERDRDLLER